MAAEGVARIAALVPMVRYHVEREAPDSRAFLLDLLRQIEEAAALPAPAAPRAAKPTTGRLLDGGGPKCADDHECWCGARRGGHSTNEAACGVFGCHEETCCIARQEAAVLANRAAVDAEWAEAVDASCAGDDAPLHALLARAKEGGKR